MSFINGLFEREREREDRNLIRELTRRAKHGMRREKKR
jgi:hypothetical protein